MNRDTLKATQRSAENRRQRAAERAALGGPPKHGPDDCADAVSRGLVCNLPRSHEGPHRLLAGNGREIAAWEIAVAAPAPDAAEGR